MIITVNKQFDKKKYFCLKFKCFHLNLFVFTENFFEKSFLGIQRNSRDIVDNLQCKIT